MTHKEHSIIWHGFIHVATVLLAGLTTTFCTGKSEYPRPRIDQVVPPQHVTGKELVVSIKGANFLSMIQRTLSKADEFQIDDAFAVTLHLEGVADNASVSLRQVARMSSEELVGQIPKDIPVGLYRVRVTTPLGLVAERGDAFRVIAVDSGDTDGDSAWGRDTGAGDTDSRTDEDSASSTDSESDEPRGTDGESDSDIETGIVIDTASSPDQATDTNIENGTETETAGDIGTETATVADAGDDSDAGLDGGKINEGDTGDMLTCALGGVLYEDICWYLGAPGASCVASCEGRGGYHPDTPDYIGSADQGGSVLHCSTLFQLLGYNNIYVTTSYSTFYPGLGCHTAYGAFYWMNDRAFDPESIYNGVMRVCGCYPTSATSPPPYSP